jgi:lipid-binding SYLF domain-containing protein
MPENNGYGSEWSAWTREFLRDHVLEELKRTSDNTEKLANRVVIIQTQLKMIFWIGGAVGGAVIVNLVKDWLAK